MRGNAGITDSAGCYRRAACLIPLLPRWLSVQSSHGQESIQPQITPVIYSPSCWFMPFYIYSAVMELFCMEACFLHLLFHNSDFLFQNQELLLNSEIKSQFWLFLEKNLVFLNIRNSLNFAILIFFLWILSSTNNFDFFLNSKFTSCNSCFFSLWTLSVHLAILF